MKRSSQAEEIASAESLHPDSSFSEIERERERDDEQLNNWLIKEAVYFTISTRPSHFQERPEGREQHCVAEGTR